MEDPSRNSQVWGTDGWLSKNYTQMSGPEERQRATGREIQRVILAQGLDLI